jgi:hypothetical protein
MACAAPAAPLVGYAAFLMHHHQLLPHVLLSSVSASMLWVLQQQPGASAAAAAPAGAAAEPPGQTLVCSSAAGLHLAPWLLHDSSASSAAEEADSNIASSDAAGSSTSSFEQLCHGVIAVRLPSQQYLAHGSRQQWCSFIRDVVHCGSALFKVQQQHGPAQPEDLLALAPARGAGQQAGPAAAGGQQQGQQQWQVVDYDSAELEAVLQHWVAQQDGAMLAALLALVDSWWGLELGRCSRRRAQQGRGMAGLG